MTNKKIILPKYDDAPFEALFERYKDYASVDKQRAMRRRQSKHVNEIKLDLDNILQNKDYTTEDPEERKKAAAKIIEHLAKDWYKNHLDLEVEELTEEHLHQYLNDSGILQQVGGSYSGLLKHLVDNESSLDPYDENSNQALNALINHTAQARDYEGHDLQKVRRTLAEQKHYDKLKENIESVVGEEFNKSITSQDLFREHARYLQKVDDKPKKTYQT